MLVGQALSGKSMVMETLSEGMNLLNSEGHKEYEKVQYQVINPKAVTQTQLYGHYEPTSLEWKDGIITKVFREFSSADTSNRRWLVLDGPVDAIWVENMNMVMDDNKKLCLASNELIPQTANMSIVFEVADLAVASVSLFFNCLGLKGLRSYSIWITFAIVLPAIHIFISIQLAFKVQYLKFRL